ncbi:MAG: ABC transporter permease [Gammaproteobacteria bacterium]|nr:ABC transporter permease [Gammaproteobacteria bacterium]
MSEAESKMKRRTRHKRWFEFKKPISTPAVFTLGISVWVIFFGLWELSVPMGWVTELLVPGPSKVASALYELFTEKAFLNDVGISVYRIIVSFIGAALVAVPMGILMGSFRTVEAFLNPFVSAWRYLPAPSFIPILLMWFGTGDAPKLALLFIGVVWFMATIIMDHTKNVRTELIETAQTLGANRWQILKSIVIPAVLPDVMIALRQMLAVSWTYLVIAEIVASTNGIGAMMMRAKRFIHTDEIIAGIIVIGVLGLLFDYLFRVIHRLMFPYLEDHGR